MCDFHDWDKGLHTICVHPKIIYIAFTAQDLSLLNVSQALSLWRREELELTFSMRSAICDCWNLNISVSKLDNRCVLCLKSRSYIANQWTILSSDVRANNVGENNQVRYLAHMLHKTCYVICIIYMHIY